MRERIEKGDTVQTLHSHKIFVVGYVEDDEDYPDLQWIWDEQSPPKDDDYLSNWAYPSSNLAIVSKANPS